jgi:hypothetical protein
MKVSEELLVTHSHRSSLSGGHSRSMTVSASSRRKILEEKRKLRACLPEIVAELAALLSKETALARTREARTVNGLVRAFAKELEGQDGLGTNYAATILGTISDLSLMHDREYPRHPLRALPFETPSDIVRWFAAYLEEKLDKPDLRLVETESQITLDS